MVIFHSCSHMQLFDCQSVEAATRMLYLMQNHSSCIGAATIHNFTRYYLTSGPHSNANFKIIVVVNNWAILRHFFSITFPSQIYSFRNI